MTIFVIGHSKSGKSTLSSLLSSDLGCDVISAGGWVRNAFAGQKPTRKEMDDYSCAALKKNLNICKDYILAGMVEQQNSIIEGIRNPRDFTFLYQPGDIVIIMKLNPAIEESEFETKGIAAIESYLEFEALTNEVEKAEIIIDTNVEGDVVKYAASVEQIYANLKIRFNGLFIAKTN